jgi:hypothetical protein
MNVYEVMTPSYPPFSICSSVWFAFQNLNFLYIEKQGLVRPPKPPGLYIENTQGLVGPPRPPGLLSELPRV